MMVFAAACEPSCLCIAGFRYGYIYLYRLGFHAEIDLIFGTVHFKQLSQHTRLGRYIFGMTGRFCMNSIICPEYA